MERERKASRHCYLFGCRGEREGGFVCLLLSIGRKGNASFFLSFQMRGEARWPAVGGEVGHLFEPNTHT